MSSVLWEKEQGSGMDKNSSSSDFGKRGTKEQKEIGGRVKVA